MLHMMHLTLLLSSKLPILKPMFDMIVVQETSAWISLLSTPQSILASNSLTSIKT